MKEKENVYARKRIVTINNLHPMKNALDTMAKEDPKEERKAAAAADPEDIDSEDEERNKENKLYRSQVPQLGKSNRDFPFPRTQDLRGNR